MNATIVVTNCMAEVMAKVLSPTVTNRKSMPEHGGVVKLGKVTVTLPAPFHFAGAAQK